MVKYASFLPLDASNEEKAAAVMGSVDERDFYLTADDVRNMRVKHIDCVWKKAKRDVQSMFISVCLQLLFMIHVHVTRDVTEIVITFGAHRKPKRLKTNRSYISLGEKLDIIC